MDNLLRLPHHTAHAQCMVNGIRDLIHWYSGHDWSNEFIYGLGQGSGFVYLRIKKAIPPRQVYWGIDTPRQHEYLAKLLNAKYNVVENRTFKFTWKRACEFVKEGTPPVLGPLDMFYLPYYEHLYHKRHIPIHYILLVGYDEQNAYILDTDMSDIQTVPLNELELAWDVNVPAMGKKNRFIVFKMPKESMSVKELIGKSLADKCHTMLRPPVNMLGIPGLKKLAKEITSWRDELGKSATDACLKQVREYLNVPPDNIGNHLTATRDLYIKFLYEAGPMAGVDFTTIISHLRKSMGIISNVAQNIQRGELQEAAESIFRIAEIETEAYTKLNEISTVTV